jgi:predicted nucleic acid-binding protein
MATDVQLLVVDEVISEVRRPPAAPELRRALDFDWFQRYSLSSDEEYGWISELRQRTPRLGPGEVASLAACLVNNWAFATDDRDARRLASSIRRDRPVAVTGTIGLLVSAVRRGVIDLSSAETVYQAMIDEGFRTPIERLADLLGQ